MLEVEQPYQRWGSQASSSKHVAKPCEALWLDLDALRPLAQPRGSSSRHTDTAEISRWRGMNREKWSERGSSVKSLFSSKLDASRKVSSNSFDKSLYQSGQKRQEPANIAFLHCHVTSYCTSILRKIGSLRVRTFSLIQSRLNIDPNISKPIFQAGQPTPTPNHS